MLYSQYVMELEETEPIQLSPEKFAEQMTALQASATELCALLRQTYVRVKRRDLRNWYLAMERTTVIFLHAPENEIRILVNGFTQLIPVDESNKFGRTVLKEAIIARLNVILNGNHQKKKSPATFKQEQEESVLQLWPVKPEDDLFGYMQQRFTRFSEYVGIEQADALLREHMLVGFLIGSVMIEGTDSAEHTGSFITHQVHKLYLHQQEAHMSTKPQQSNDSSLIEEG